jgi:hypothetical protein
MAIEFGPKDRYRTYGVPSLDLPFADRKSLVDRISGNNLITFTRSTTGTYVGSDGLIKTASVNEARFDHNPATGEILGLLVEEARTNVLQYSQDFTNAYWTKTNSSVAFSSGLAPDNTSTVNRLTCSTNGAASVAVNYAPSTAATFTVSCYFSTSSTNKYPVLSVHRYNSNSAGAKFNLINGTVVLFGSTTSAGFANPLGVTASITNVGNGFYRCSFSYSRPGINNEVSISLGDSRSTNIFAYGTAYISNPASAISVTAGEYLDFWGLQYEQGAFPTSYIPTTASTVTRAADVASITGTNFSSWYNQSQGSFLLNAPLLNRINANQLVVGSTSSVPTEGVQFWNSSGSGIRYRVYVGGNLEVDSTGSTYEGAKWAWTYQLNDCKLFKNSIVALTDSLAAMPTAATQLVIGYEGQKLISRLTYYPTRIPDTTLQALTKP